MKLQYLLAAAALASAAAAQNDDVITVNVPLENLGSLELASGVITPAPTTGAQFAIPGIPYNNNCLPYAVAPCNSVIINSVLAGQTRIDDGRMPSTTSPIPSVGTMNAYRITSFQMGYCTTEDDTTIGGPGARFTISFWENYDRCTEMTVAGAPTKAFNLVLPGTLTTGTNRCVLININLVGGFEFSMKADADGAYGGTQQLDNFGYGYGVTTVTAGKTNYVIRAGQVPPANGGCTVGDGTYFQNPGGAGTGLDDDNTYWLQTAPAAGTCFAGAATNTLCAAPQNGPIYGGFYMQLTADMTDCDANGNPDFDDIAAGAPDVNANGIPDSCEGPPPPFNYCTAGTTTNGCLATMSATGTASAAATSGFTLTVSAAEGQKQGIIFYGNLGPAAAPWINGLGQGNSFLCVKAPTQRTGAATMSGTLNVCDGSMSVDFLAFCAATPGALGTPLAAGQTFNSQAWFRDPPSPKTTNLSDGLQFTLVP